MNTKNTEYFWRIIKHILIHVSHNQKKERSKPAKRDNTSLDDVLSEFVSYRNSFSDDDDAYD